MRMAAVVGTATLLTGATAGIVATSEPSVLNPTESGNHLPIDDNHGRAGAPALPAQEPEPVGPAPAPAVATVPATARPLDATPSATGNDGGECGDQAPRSGRG